VLADILLEHEEPEVSSSEDVAARPIWGTLLTLERLLPFARTLAASQEYQTTGGPRVTPLLPFLDEAEHELGDFQRFMSSAVRAGHVVPPATEWLLDNEYLIEEQFVRVREDLPRRYGAELPHLLSGGYTEFPRIYEAMVALVRHTDARLDRDYLYKYVQAFQGESPLVIGEIWAIPIMLRIALVENLRRLASFIRSAYEDDRVADRMADELIGLADDRPDLIGEMLRQIGRESDRASAAFFLRLYQRLRDVGPQMAPVAEWLDRRVRALDVPLQRYRTDEHHRQAVNQVSVANSVTSIRFLTALDWRGFFESVSHVERLLRDDPANVYSRMTFLSRDRYRNAIEGLARRCPHDELAVARAVLERAAESRRQDPDDQVKAHVGWYLVSGGRYGFEESLGYRLQRRERMYRGPLRRSGLLFFGLFTVVTLLLALSASVFIAAGDTIAWKALLLGLVAVIPLSDIALTLVNRIATAIWRPRLLPSLDSSRGLAEEHRTLVVTTTLVRSTEAALDAASKLEIHYLTGSQDPEVHFALACELPDSDEQESPADRDIIDTASREIERLNRLHGGTDGRSPFHLFVRRRTWNDQEVRWMGWERKRGALWELNRYLREAGDTTISLHVGDEAFLPKVVFMLALDADTVLPRDGVRRLASVIAHPLNRARMEADTRRVTRGYGLVQPRVSVSLPSAGRTGFSWMHTGVIGIDPYGGVVSDVYQDVFGEGSFNGKAIWEVDTFLSVLDGRIPENRLLSHDLLEGNYLRVGLASDIEVFDEFPSTYSRHIARLHRWIRGDWQALPWLLPRVPLEDGSFEVNPLSGLHRWKLLDNLRRSLVAPLLLIMFGMGYLLAGGNGAGWALIIVGITFFPAVLQFIDAVLSRPRGLSPRRTYTSILGDLRRDVARALFALATLPHLAWVSVDAIARSLWRSIVSHRRMLEWTTAAEAEQQADMTLGVHVRAMWSSVVLALALVTPGLFLAPAQRVTVVSLMLLWTLSPVVVHVSGRRLTPARRLPSRSEHVRMRAFARRTWRFFDTFASEEDHWLIPDNFQEDPKGEIAHRTSPTNIGLQLLSYLAAYDLGYLAIPGLVEKTSATLGTLVGMERFRGHFYNWYDTRTLEPLHPGYISTVDSGNLAGHLLVLRHGLLEMADRPFIGASVRQGLEDTITEAAKELAREHWGEEMLPVEPAAILDSALESLRSDIPLENLGDWSVLLRGLDWILSPFQSLADTPRGRARAGAARAILDALRDVRCLREELVTYAPWIQVLETSPAELIDEQLLSDGFAVLMDDVPSLVTLASGMPAVVEALEIFSERDLAVEWCHEFVRLITEGTVAADSLLARLQLLADISKEIWEHTDFGILYDPSRMLFSIGFNTAEGRLDDSYYDLLASECRLASFLAVAKGDVPSSHWFRLGRSITTASDGYALVSWSASMFEYLMPLLVMRSWPDTILDETYYTVVRRQVQYALQTGVPWGISESAFNAKDADLNYQYQTFGIPGLGLKRGLSDDVVVAPYATMLALPIDRRSALSNLQALEKRDAMGYFGFYEAIDYTPGRIPAGAERAVVKTYMAHHQGMSLVALANEIDGYAFQRRFHDDPLVRSADLLLQERTPQHISVEHPHTEEVRSVRSIRELPQPIDRSYPTPHTPVPATHFLSNGSYSVMLTNAGGGYSRCGDLDVSRYREDVTRDPWGMFVYLRDVDSGAVWSAAYQPMCVEPDTYNVTFSADKAEYRRHDGTIETHTEVIVSTEDNVEIRRVTVTNHGRKSRRLEVTSYFEIGMAPNAADQAHRAFSNLFIETEAPGAPGALLFSRRTRSAEERRPWGFHVLACDPVPSWEPSHETDRARFLGRLRQPTDALAVEHGGRLSDTVGAVLDPVCAFKQEVEIDPGETVRLAFATGIADSRHDAVALADMYRDMRSAQRAFDLSWISAQIVLRDLGITPEDAVLFERLASRLLLTDPYSPLKVHTSIENGLPLSALWPLGISGDNPILLVRIERPEDMSLVRDALLAHQYWRFKGLIADLVVLNTRSSAYSDELHDRLALLVRTRQALELLDRPGGVFLRRSDQMNPDVLNLLVSVARAVVDGDKGSISLQLAQRDQSPDPLPPLVFHRAPDTTPPPPFERPQLDDDNGIGGFDPETGEYVIVLDGDTTTPAPWINVMASERGFGTMISEAGIGCTWDINSHENRLTTWNNDSVSDGSGETFYVRDEETGVFWSPTSLPVRSDRTYVVRHGFGYSSFAHHAHGIDHLLTVFVPLDDPVRVARLELSNRSDRRRTLTVTHFVEWSLGESRSRAQQRVTTWFDIEADMLTAHNHFNLDMPGRATFLAADHPVDSYTGSRTEFLGRNGRASDPAAMHKIGLGSQTGRFHDAAGVISVRVNLDPGQSSSVTFLLGQTDTLDEARSLVEGFRESRHVQGELDRVRAAWHGLASAITIETPDPRLDRLVNGWLLYQTYSCRLLGRSALYQSSGAFGFRDQLQDSLALLHVRPDVVRDRIIDSARRQFSEGDVLHWWMPVSGRGVRTRISDDRHWLPYVVSEYLRVTGDEAVLDEVIPYIQAPILEDDQDDVYMAPAVSERSGTIYEHCVVALETARHAGPHGLPLMGGGDWNDGMNRVAAGGTGESVWLAWFLDVTLCCFADIAERRGDTDRADSFRTMAAGFVDACERHGWDGAWYRRAYFDDGTPLGTAKADECRIDAIAQAWAAISGSGDSRRADIALDSVDAHLVDNDLRLIRLLDPPFDRTEHDPGYIKGYVPGVRENGGQYTHGVLWVALAHILRGNGDRAYEILDLLNPTTHALDLDGVNRYAVEPYVVAADVYTAYPHEGRGGWTWYTGSAAWFWRIVVNHLLGLRLESIDGVPHLVIDPCLPTTWDGFRARYMHADTLYAIEVRAPEGIGRGVATIEIDGRIVDGRAIPLADDGQEHKIVVGLGPTIPIEAE